VGVWEEPHPGQRFSLPPARNTGPCCDHHTSVGGLNKIGMAAKGFTPYGNRLRVPGTGNRRLSRSRLRPMSLKPLRIPTRFSRPSHLSVSVSTPVAVNRLKRSASAEFTPPMKLNPASDDGAESDGISRPLSCAIETIASSELSSPRISMTDFSNHLSIAFGEDFETPNSRSGLTRHDYHAVRSTGEDPYGWEAELNRKLTCSAIEFQQAGGMKRGLLQRVFSLGPRGMS